MMILLKLDSQELKSHYTDVLRSGLLNWAFKYNIFIFNNKSQKHKLINIMFA